MTKRTKPKPRKPAKGKMPPDGTRWNNHIYPGNYWVIRGGCVQYYHCEKYGSMWFWLPSIAELDEYFGPRIPPARKR